MDRLTCSTGQLIDILGVSRKTITIYVQEGMPKLGHGRFYLPDALQWLIPRLSGNRANPTLDEARKRLYQAQTEKTNLEIAERKAELVEYEEAAGVLYKVARNAGGKYGLRRQSWRGKTCSLSRTQQGTGTYCKPRGWIISLSFNTR